MLPVYKSVSSHELAWQNNFCRSRISGYKWARGPTEFKLRILGYEQNPEIALVISSTVSLDLKIHGPLTSRVGSGAIETHPLAFTTTHTAKRLIDKTATGNHDIRYDSQTETWFVAERGWFGSLGIDWNKAKQIKLSEDLAGNVASSEFIILLDPKEYQRFQLFSDFRVLSKNMNITVRVPEMNVNGQVVEAREFKFYRSKNLRLGFERCL